MKVWELIAALEGFDDDDEVRIAHQPSWPFEYSIGEIARADARERYEIARDDDGWYALDHVGHDEPAGPFETLAAAEEAIAAEIAAAGDVDGVVYIAEGTQIGYLPGAARSAVGW